MRQQAWRLAHTPEMRWMLQLEHGTQALVVVQLPGVRWVRGGWQCDPPGYWAVGLAPAPREAPLRLVQEHAAGRPAAQGQQQVLAEVLPGAQQVRVAQGLALGADAGLLGYCSAG